MDKPYILHTGDALGILQSMPDKSVQCVVTSPPYWGLRDYGIDGQLGLETAPEKYIATMVDVFREIHRVLRGDGTLWVNLGDSYSSGGNGGGPGLQRTSKGSLIGKKNPPVGMKPKNLIGIPWRLAFALQDDGWYLRSDIIWSKPNPMPESVRDRPTRSHEYIFLFSRSRKYYYNADAIREPYTPSTIERLDQRGFHAQPGGPKDSRSGNRSHRNTLENLKKKVDKQRGHGRRHAGFNDRWDAMSKEEQQSCGANKRTVWNIATRPFTEAHFATFPIEIPLTCIRAGTRHGDLVLDPFSGAGTTGVAACSLGREYIGIELNPEYNEMAERRLIKACRQDSFPFI